MSNPVAFASATPNFGLPLLFSGQAQKEFFVNQSHALLDMLVHTAVKGVAPSAPPTPQPGDCWLVDSNASGSWADYSDHVAVRVGSEWQFVAPRSGMHIFDSSAGQFLLYDSQWQSAQSPAAPQGGGIIDNEARAAIVSIIDQLRNIGVFSRS